MTSLILSFFLLFLLSVRAIISMQSVITRSRLVEGNYLKEILEGKQKNVYK